MTPHFRISRLLAMLCVLACLGGGSLVHAAITPLHDFCAGYTDARYPQYTSPVLSGDTLYAMTNQGGRGNQGTIFKVNTDGTGYAILHEFTGGADGGSPMDSLMADGDVLYGMTRNGGASNLGTFFKIDTDGTDFTVLHTFAGGAADGAEPFGAPIISLGTLYGTTYTGGASNKGVVFKIQPDGTGFEVIHTFTGANGANPHHDVMLLGSWLIGMTQKGGANNVGVIFKVRTDGSESAVIHTFADGAGNGKEPEGGLVCDGTFLYGMTHQGNNTAGTIFKIKPDGSEFTIMHSCTGAANDASLPDGSLVLSGATLYGMTSRGGQYVMGVAFKINTDGTGFGIVRSFGNGNDLDYLLGSFAIAGSTFYGLAFTGGVDDCGGVFKLNTDGTGYASLHDFRNTTNDGNYPYGSPIAAGGTLFGLTNMGGEKDSGIIYAVQPDGTGFQMLHAFMGGNDDGAYPGGSPVWGGGVLYGMAGTGGPDDAGVVWRMDDDGTGFAVLHAFAGGAGDGGSPMDSLILDGATLYGMTYGGGADSKGVVYKIGSDGSDFTVLHEFSGEVDDGASPYGSLLLAGGNLYGMTSAGGAHGQGVIFTLGTDGGGFTLLRSFAGGDDDGGTPNGSLISDGTRLYGMTSAGGDDNKGVIFSLLPNGDDFLLLHEFAGGNADGEGTWGNLTLTGTTLYGMTYGGGDEGAGVLFTLETDGSLYTVLEEFAGQPGPATPYGSFCLDGNTLYGMTSYGGAYNTGLLFSYALPTPPAAPVATAATEATPAGFTANWQAADDATGYRLDVAVANAFTVPLAGYWDLAVGNVTSKAVTVAAFTRHYYRVRAVNDAGAGADSNAITVELPRPDVHLRAESDDDYAGDDVYSADGAGQTRAVALTGARAAYLFHLQNDGTSADTLTLTGPAGSDGWTVAYRTMGETPVDVTAQVTGAGWTTKALTPGQFDLLQVLVTPSGAVTPGVAFHLVLTAAAGSNADVVDAAKMTTTLTVVRMADLAVRTSAEDAYTGNNVYNDTGAGQSKAQSTAAGVPVTYVFRAQNDGNLSDTFTVTGPAGGAGWTIKYYTTTGDITAAVTAAGWSTGALAPGAVKTLWAVVKCSTSVAGDAQHTVTVTLTSNSDADATDSATGVTTNANSYQPDVLIRTAAEAGYTGGNVYAADGAGQTKALNAAGGTAATYLIRLQNDGNAADSFLVTGTAGADGWTVRYFAAGVGEITADVTGAGWTTASLARGAAVGLWFTVMPSLGVAPGISCDVLCTAASTHNGAVVDAAKGLTTRP